MIPSLRKQFNDQFTPDQYKQYLSYIDREFPNAIDFRIAETPLFIDANFKNKLLAVGNYITQFILAPNFKAITKGALASATITNTENNFPDCLVIDYAITQNEQGELTPALIELQGFPSLFAFEVLQNKAIRSAYTIPAGYSCFLNGYDEQSYLSHLREVINGPHNKCTVLLELFPDKQKTRIDFYCTKQMIGTPIVCLSEIYGKGKDVFYMQDGVEYKIERIYNRVVGDELKSQTNTLKENWELLLNAPAIEWVNHPNHFYRISKYLIPFLQHPYIPITQLLSKVERIPQDLENFVLKPLYSFAGQGVIIDLTTADILQIKDPENWILQKKVKYAEIIETPDGKAKAEIRLFYFYDYKSGTYIATNNLTRLSKGKMIGVNYNKTATWVGGSLSYFEI